MPHILILTCNFDVIRGMQRNKNIIFQNIKFFLSFLYFRSFSLSNSRMTIFHLCHCSTANERYYFIRERKTVRNCNACKQKEEEKKARKISCGEDSKSVKFNKRTYSMLISRSRHTDPHNTVRCFYGGTQVSVSWVLQSQWVHECAKLPRLFVRRTDGMLVPRYN